jgi:hemin uptake protein HemP
VRRTGEPAGLDLRLIVRVRYAPVGSRVRTVRAPAVAEAVPRPTPRRRVQSADLFGDAREVIIVHRAGEYRLTITRAGKLLLTK